MKILVIGGGGREHAIAWRLALEPGVEVWASPGNPGTARVATCLAPPSSGVDGYLQVAASVQPDLTVVGPEAPLVAGLADALQSKGFRVLGPTRKAAQLEASKIFAKQVMVEAAIPTAAYRVTQNLDQAMQCLREFSYPLVLKADGLAAGKGVVIAHDQPEAQSALRTLHSTLGPRIVIEEFLHGEEASFIVLSDGKQVIPLEASQDHKAIRDNDEGPNTGGMGAYCDGRILTPVQTAAVMDRVVRPAIDYMSANGAPFTGFLYAGLMMTPQGPKVLEFNVRLGDPETQSLLHRIQGGFSNALYAAASRELAGVELDWKTDPSVCVVMASAGYPEQPRIGDPISGVDEAETSGAVVFQAGTRVGPAGLETAGGRVLGVTASGGDLRQAIDNAYRGVASIHFDGMQFRKDIGRKGLKRW
ncbi:MAG: phosphoribosylamine--glycine ligase [Bryobacterales bacterium]|nr:phosphoribosylamine--glycine ligase [Bryobacterales bacterium]